MFKKCKYYVIVRNSSFVVIKDGDNFENIIELQTFVPTVPAYYHLFDSDDKKEYIDNIKKQIKKLKIKEVIIIIPDDAMEIEVDKILLREFFRSAGVKKVQVNFQCYFMSSDNKKYISISKTNRLIVMNYIIYNKSITRKYYDKDYDNIEQMKADIKNIHIDNAYNEIPVYINNLNCDLDSYGEMGRLISVRDLVSNAMSNNKSL